MVVRLRNCERALRPTQLHAQRLHDGAGDLFLNREQILHPPVERFRPEVHARFEYR